jgi:Uma2 family endonuclease
MSTVAHIVTAEELLQMGGDQRRELVKGELRMMAPAGFDHGAIIANLAFLLTRHVKAKNLGLVLGAETGFRLEKKPDTVRGADIAFVSAGRIPASGRPIGFFEGAPDLAVEVLSPTDTVADVEDKVDDYLRAGSLLVWVVNPKRRTVTIYRAGATPALVGEQEQLVGEAVLPGFSCAVADIFA